MANEQNKPQQPQRPQDQNRGASRPGQTGTNQPGQGQGKEQQKKPFNK